MFTLITQPKLKKLGRKNIHKFLRDCEQYMPHITYAVSSGKTIKQVSTKASVD